MTFSLDKICIMKIIFYSQKVRYSEGNYVNLKVVILIKRKENFRAN